MESLGTTVALSEGELHPIVATPIPRKRKTDRKIDQYLDTVAEKEQESLDLKLASMIYALALPLDMIEDPHFLQFANAIRPAWITPSSAAMRTVLLDKVLETVEIKEKISSGKGVLMLTTSQRGEGLNDKIIAVVTPAQSKPFFAGSWDLELTEAQLIESLETEIIRVVTNNVKKDQEIEIYGIILEDKSIECNVTKDKNLWYFMDQKALMQLAAKEFENKLLTRRLEQFFENFHEVHSSNEMLKQGGTSLCFGTLETWQERHKMYSSYVENLKIMKKIVAESTVTLRKSAVTDLFDAKFEQQVAEVLHLFNYLKSMEDQCNDHLATMADAVESWVEF